MNILPFKTRIFCGVAAAALTMQAAAAHAQTAEGQATTGAAADSGQIEDIIVTAQKRSQNIQKVPIAITAVSGDTMARAGITTADAFQQAAPGLTISNVGSGFVSYTYVRGGGTNQLDIGADPSVAYYLDEVYLGGTAGLQFDLFDIDHVEVLKGPQGTLFGRNAASGAVSIVTKRPTSHFEGYASLEGGNYGRAIARAGISGPLAGDSLRYRVSVGSKHMDGYFTNLTPGAQGDKPGKIDNLSARGQLEWVGSDVTFLLTGSKFRARNGQTGQILNTPTKTNILDAATAATFPLPGQGLYADYFRPGYENQDEGDLTGRLEWNTPIGQLTSISAYRDNRFWRLQEYSPGANSLQVFTDERDKTFSQEVRLASQGDSRLKWLTGLYYYHAVQTMIYQQIFGSQWPASPALFTSSVRTDTARLVTDSYAAFAQATYNITDKLSLTAGLRYSKDKKSNDRVLTETNGVPGQNFSAGAKDQWDALTPAVTLDYQFTPDVMGYASYRRGFKSGGFQPAPGGSAAIVSTPFNPEIVDSYEVGLKTSLFDRRVTFNIDAFISKITDQQVGTTNALAQTFVNNAGKTTAKGVDVSIKARPIPALHLSADVTYQNAKFDDYQLTPTLNVGGKRQLRSPDFTGSFSADYDLDLGNSGTLNIGGQISVRSRVFYTVTNLTTPEYFQPAYSIADAHITYEPRDSNISITGWVRNIGDTHYYSNIIVLAVTGIAQPGDPRTFGGTFNVKF